jgi:hypothetical protein
MRRLVLTTAVAVGLFALACTDERKEGPTEPASLAPTAKSPCPSTDPIQSQICALFRPTDNLKSASDFYSNIKTKKQQGRTAEAQARAVDLVNFTFKLYYEGKLLDPTGNPDPTTADAAVKLSCDVYAFVSPTFTTCPLSSDDLSSTSDEHSTLQACGPAGCLALPPDKHSGVSVGKDALLGPAFIRVKPEPATFPRGGPLHTPKDQYLLFRHFELLGFDHFEKNVLVGICHLDPEDGDFAPPTAAVEGRLKLARNITVGGEFETIEEFDRVAAPFLDCSDFNSSDDEVPTFEEGSATFLQGQLGSAGRALGRTIAPILLSLLPEPAEATVVGGCCLGGATSRLSEWGAVDSLSGQEVEFFRDDEAGETFNPGDHTFTTGFILSWTYTTDGSATATAYPAVQVIDPTSGPRSGVNVTVSLIQVDGSGTLSGTLTRTTSAAAPASEDEPAAVFDDLKISQSGTYQLRFTFTAPGLPSDAIEDSGIFTVQDQIN